MNRAYLLTGSNIGNREEALIKAIVNLNLHCGSVINTSSIYETAPWGKTDQPAFLNQAIELHTTLNARQLIRKILKVEKLMGRERKEKFGPRLIDIDILLFNTEIHNYPLLKIPHPEIQNRRFVLMPMAEIAPVIIHPVLHKSISDLLLNCPDKLDVKKF